MSLPVVTINSDYESEKGEYLTRLSRSNLRLHHREDPCLPLDFRQ